MNDVKVKICGVTTVSDARMCAEAGADFIGLNFWPQSKRMVAREQARDVAAAARAVRAGIAVVGVFVNQPATLIEALIEAVHLDFVQLHGDESPAFCEAFGERAIKAVALASDGDLRRISEARTDRVLIDAPSAGRGGSGIRIDPALVARATASSCKLFVAGGLTADNIAGALSAMATGLPYAVDVASGVERAPGIKDEAKVHRFIANVRAAPKEAPP